MSIHKSDIKTLNTLLNDAFLNAADTTQISPAYKIISSRSLPKSVQFKFVFFPGLMSRAYGGTVVGRDACHEIASYIEQYLDDSQFHYGGKYTLKPNSFKYKVEEGERDGIPDYYIEGSFAIQFNNSKAGRASSFGEIEILYRGDKRRSNPSKSTSVLGALILGGIIGHSLK